MQRGRFSEINLFLRVGLDLNHQNETGNTALHKAISLMNYQSAAVLIKRGAKINIPNL
jgi:ankyrin repeat protein